MPALSGANVNRGVSHSSSDLGHIKFCTLNDGVTFKENDTVCFSFLSDITERKKGEVRQQKWESVSFLEVCEGGGLPARCCQSCRNRGSLSANLEHFSIESNHSSNI